MLHIVNIHLLTLRTWACLCTVAKLILEGKYRKTSVQKLIAVNSLSPILAMSKLITAQVLHVKTRSNPALCRNRLKPTSSPRDSHEECE